MRPVVDRVITLHDESLPAYLANESIFILTVHKGVMTFHTALSGENFTASQFRTFEWLLARVESPMLLQMMFRDKFLDAELALEHIARVLALVVHPRCSVFEFLVAFITHVLVFIRVKHHMPLEILSGDESFAADIAFEWFFTGVSPHMGPHILRSGEALVAIRTFEFVAVHVEFPLPSSGECFLRAVRT